MPPRKLATRSFVPALFAPLAFLALGPLASAQLGNETFDYGQNVDGWIAWNGQYTTVESAGGNPLEYLRLNNLTTGPTACNIVSIEPSGGGPYTLSGDWRAAGVEQVTVDLNIEQGRYGGIMCLFIVSDPGTPAVPSDDCYLVLILPAPAGPGWQRYVYPVPTAQTTAPAGWFGENACIGSAPDQVWNSVLTDVDRIFFLLDALPGTACQATRWDLGVDNITIQSGNLGTIYCNGAPNSTGVGAWNTGSGSDVIAVNDVTFDVGSLPLNSFGYFIMSQTTARTPVFSGDICVGGVIYRHSLSVRNSGGVGEIQFSPDLTNLPQGISFQPGESWCFQYWYRDIGPTANFSDAVQIEFR